MLYDTLSGAVYRYLDAFILDEKLTVRELNSLLKFIASQQGAAHCYRGLYGISETEWDNPQMTYMGEKLTTMAGKTHVLGELASFVLHHSKSSDPEIMRIRNTATENIMGYLRTNGVYGNFCCKKCSVALWLHASQLASPDAPKHLLAAIEMLENHRDGKGRWTSFPFYDTVLALYFMDIPDAKAELDYALPSLSKIAGREGKTVWEKRRIALAVKVSRGK